MSNFDSISDKEPSAFTVEFSNSLDLLTLLRIWILVVLFFFVPITAFQTATGVISWKSFWITVIFSFSAPTAFAVIYDLPIVFVQKAKLGHIKLEVVGSTIRAHDFKRNRQTEFALHDIEDCDLIRYPFTSYHVVRMYINDGRKVSFGNSMTNYVTLVRRLKRQQHIKPENLEKYFGSGIENVF